MVRLPDTCFRIHDPALLLVRRRVRAPLAAAMMLAASALGCGESSAGGAMTGSGGSLATGGTSGGTPASGGTVSNATGGVPTGGTSPTGGNGGKATAGGSAGRAEGGSPSGGMQATGGGGATAGAGEGGTSTGGGGGVATGGGATGGSGTGGSGGASSTELSFVPPEGIWSYVRELEGPTLAFELDNSGATAASITTLAIEGDDPDLFRIEEPPSLPATIEPGATLSISVQFVTNVNPPAAPAADDGSVPVSATLVAATGSGAAQAGLWGLVVTAAGMVAGGEATLGQSLQTLGYDIDIGPDLQDHLENGISTTPQGDEVAAERFVKAGAGSVVMKPVARWAPSGAMPYGYYTVADPSCPADCETVGTMSTNEDANTSNGGRMLLPPLDAMGQNGGFDPGDAPFGVWAYTDQVSQNVSTGGDAQNGDYLFTEDDLNVPASRAHRVRAWPLRDRAGNPVENSYLLGCEEAGNGDYNDYVFVLSNVAPAP